MSFYPPKISERFHAPKNVKGEETSNASGTGASFVCGSFARFFLDIDPATKTIREAKFRSDGCGFAVAAADVLAETIKGKNLTELHGFDKREMKIEIENKLERFPPDRAHCAVICLDALEKALANFRAALVEEFAGEKALICTCFGVSEEEIETVIDRTRAETAEEVAEACRAGSGCGSCRFLIQEMIDVYWNDRF